MAVVGLGLKDWPAYLAWAGTLSSMGPQERLEAILTRYPHGTTLKGIQGMMGMGQTQKARRKLDAMLRAMEKAGTARVVRAGVNGEARLWAKS